MGFAGGIQINVNRGMSKKPEPVIFGATGFFALKHETTAANVSLASRHRQAVQSYLDAVTK